MFHPSEPVALLNIFPGLSVVGITSFVQLLWSTSLTGLMRFTAFRSRNRRDRERSTMSYVLIVLVLVGATRYSYLLAYGT